MRRTGDRVPGYVKVSVKFYNPYAAIPATAEIQISKIGEISPFFFFLEPKVNRPILANARNIDKSITPPDPVS